ncbi:DUF7503 family protein [Natrinema marinum]
MTDITNYLKNHPRMIGGLFTLMLLLAQAGNVAATNGTRFLGP